MWWISPADFHARVAAVVVAYRALDVPEAPPVRYDELYAAALRNLGAAREQTATGEIVDAGVTHDRDGRENSAA